MAYVEMSLLPGGRAHYIKLDGVMVPDVKKVTVIGSSGEFTVVHFEVHATEVVINAECDSVTKHVPVLAAEHCQCPIVRSDLPSGSECMVCGKPVVVNE